MADMDQWKTGVSNVKYLVHLVRMDRLIKSMKRVLWCA